MVVLGGLEIAAVGYLLNEFNKGKMEERERRKQSNERRDSEHHDRPHSRPHSNSRPPPPQPYHLQASSTNLLAPPSAPIRPLSAPPQDPRPEWQRQQGYQQQGQHMGPQFQHQQPVPMPPNAPQQGPPSDAYPFQSHLWHKQQAQQAQQHRPSPPPNFGPGPNQPPNQNPLWQAGPQPGSQGPAQFHTQPPPMNHPPQQYNNNQSMNGPPPPGPGIQRPQTFQQGQQHPSPNQPFIQPSNTFPQQPQFQQPPPPHHQPPPQLRPQTAPAPINQQPPTGPLVYINTKTGKVSHNLYPADHPMHRPSTSTSNPNLPPAQNPNASSLSLARANTDLNTGSSLPKEFWGDEKYMRTMAGDIHTGLLWSDKDEDDLAYGTDYSYEREQRRRRERQRRKESLGREVSYERVRTDRDRGREGQWV